MTAIGPNAEAQGTNVGVFQNRWQPSANAIWTLGRHTVSFGADYSYTQLANLARYEEIKVDLDTPPYKAALAKVDALEEKRAKVDFTLTDRDGKSWTRSALKGKVVLVNFWATWCPPCKKEMPDLDALYTRFKDKGLVILAISDEKGETCAAFLERALAYFSEHGITTVERLMTDNAWAYRWSLRQVCAEHGIRQKFIRPHCPWQNGKAERYNRTLATEWAYARVYLSNDDRTAALDPWLASYNTDRAHSALGGLSPLQRLSPRS